QLPDDGIDDGLSEYRNRPGKMSKRCQEEWTWAEEKCQEEKFAYYDRGEFDKPFDMDACERGYGSEACGGKRIDWGPKGKPYKPPQKPTAKRPRARPYKPLQA